MKKLFLLIAFVFMSVSAQAQIPSTLGWYEVPNTKIRPVCQGGPANTQCQNIIVAWSSGVFDSIRNRMIIWGGGHNDYLSNEVYAINLTGIPTAERLTTGCSSPDAFNEVCTGSNPPQPQSRHTYDAIEFMPTVDKMFSWTMAWSNQSAWSFSMGPQTWAQISTANSNLGYASGGEAIAYDPTSSKLFIFDGIKLVTFDPATNTFTTVGSAYNLPAGMSAAIDPVGHRYVAVGRGNVYSFDIGGTPPYAFQQWTTTGSTTPVGCESPGLDYDPNTNRLVAWCGGNTVYNLDTNTKIWTAVTQTGGPGAQQTYGTFGRWRYSQTVGAFVLVNSVDQNAFIWRSSGTIPPPPMDTQAPTAPTSLAASAVSTSQINLAWTPSTDNVAVTGYPLERCENATCVQITTSASTAYSDIGLTASTTYVYRIRAVDAAGNLSAYSGTVSATTNANQPPQPQGMTLTVGPGKMFATVCAAINAAQTGYTLEVDAAIYQDESCAVNKSLTLKGLGGYAHMRWGTGDYGTTTDLIPNGKATLIIQATTTIDHFEFSGAKVADENGAGIRYESGDLTITNSYFHGNQNGLLGQAGPTNTVLIENSRFDRNGFCGGGGCGHNLYVGLMGKLIFHRNISTNSLNGSHTLKSRAQVNEVTDSFLSTRDSDGSLEADFSNGGTVYFVGNTVEQGANTGNSTLLGYGLEGATNPNKKLFVSQNIFINRRMNGAMFIQTSGSPAVDYRANTFIGPGTVPSGLNTSNQVAP